MKDDLLKLIKSDNIQLTHIQVEHQVNGLVYITCEFVGLYEKQPESFLPDELFRFEQEKLIYDTR